MNRLLPLAVPRQWASLSAAILLCTTLGGCADETAGPPPSDTTAPGAITSLSVVDRNESSVTLTWHAPGDDASDGTAATYDMRYATEELTSEVWDRAHLADAGTPGAA